MINPFLCGTLHSEDEDESDYCNWSPTSTPRRSRRNSFCRRSNSKDSNKNPYASRGLDKFSALLADIEEKRQKIYSQMGPHEISLLRFAYPNSDDCVPIVVKLRERKQEDHPNPKLPAVKTQNPEAFDKAPAGGGGKELKRPGMGPDRKTGNSISSWNFMKSENWRRPSYYMPAIIIMILVLLAVFGRSVAILCTSFGWYIVPTLNAGSSGTSKKAAKKKEYARRLSEKYKVVASDHGLCSPRSTTGAGRRDNSPVHNSHRK